VKETRGLRFLALVGGSFAVASLIVLSGCSKSDDAAAASASPASYAAKAESTPYGGAVGGAMPGTVAGDTEFGGAPLHTASRQPGAQRSVLRSATLTVDVENLDKAEKQMKESVKAAGGYIDHEEGTDLASESPVMRLTIRVPERSFDDVLTGFEALGHRTQKSISASDLTEQILDSEAQLKEAQRERGEVSANDVLEPSTAARIKQLQAERDSLAAQAAMSTIDLTLQQKPNAVFATAANASWGSDTWNAALSSSLGAVRVIGAVGIWLLAFCPLWAPIAFGSIWFYRSRKRAVNEPSSHVVMGMRG